MSLLRLSIILIGCFIGHVNAEPLNFQPCQKITIACDGQWPPYTITSPKVMGIGVDIAKKILGELDVPIEEFIYNTPSELIDALQENTVDLVVSTYDAFGLANELQLLQNPYVVDQVTVAVPISLMPQITSWEDLVGMQGVRPLAFSPDKDTLEFIRSYLQVDNKDFLLADLQYVKNGTYQYIIGSDLQLSYAIKANGLDRDLIVMKNIVRGGDVHMAFSKDSPCQTYALYVQKRLQDYKNNGTVEAVVNQYIH